MKDTQGNVVLGHTRWKRFAAAIVPATLVAGGLTVMMAQGALAASFRVSGQSFKISADRLDGQGFAQFGGVDTEKGGRSHPVTVSAIANGTLSNLCQSVRTPIGGGNSVVLTITAGQGAEKVRARNLVVDAEQLDGNAVFSNIEIGRDASDLTKGGPAKGQAGMFGQQADRIVITNLRQTAWATSAGTFSLPGLKLRLKLNGSECF